MSTRTSMMLRSRSCTPLILPRERRSRLIVLALFASGDDPRLRAQAERRISVGNECERIADNAVRPAEHTGNEVEQPRGIAAREENREPGEDHREERKEPQEREQEVVRDREQ